MLALKACNWRKSGSTTPPWDYQVEYLSYAGRAFFNTGVIPSVDGTGIFVDVSLSAFEADLGAIAGVCATSLFAGGRSFSVYAQHRRGDYVTHFIHAYGPYEVTHPNFPMETRVKIEMNYLGSGRTKIGSYLDVATLRANSVQQSPIYLCALNVADTNNRRFYTEGKIYGAKLSEGNSVTRNYIPCVKDSLPALYDVVNGVFVFNGFSGGVVTPGPRV